MPAESINWLPALAVLAAGLAAGFFLVRRTARAGWPHPVTAEPLERRDLLARRDALIDQLRELQDGTTTPDAAEAARQRSTLEREAARVLRELDRLASARPARRAAEPSPTAASRRDRGGLRGFLWGAGTVAAMGLLFFSVSRSTSERAPDGAPIGQPEGAPAAADPETTRLQEAVRANPDDIGARLELARASLGRQDMMEVYNQTRAVLQRSPGNPRALSYQALVRLAMGQPEAAERMLRQALATDPDLLEGYIHLSLVHLRQGRLDKAEADIQEAERRHPAQAPRLHALWAQIRTQAEAAPAAGEGEATAGAAPHAGLPEPDAGGASEADERAVTGSLELGPGAESAPGPGAVVFLTLRAPGATGGPPLAARRLLASSFPLAFSIGSADSMMGAALPERVRVEARVDADGDPLTRDPRDPVAAADDVRVGTKGLRLVLRRPTPR